MLPNVALILCICLICWLFRLDIKWRNYSSATIWIPGIWIAILGSRPVSYWFTSSSDIVYSDLDTNPYNLIIFGTLVIASFFVLKKRISNVRLLISNNKALFLLYLYFFASALWSDYTFVCIKRLARDFGAVLVALVIITERNPAEAFRAVIVRVGYLIFPFSILVIKYFPSIGRSYTNAGEPMWTGVTTNKNTLGQVVFVVSIILLWDILETHKHKGHLGRQMFMCNLIGISLLGIWLLVLCDSKTSLVCMFLAIIAWALVAILAKSADPKRSALYALLIVIAVASADQIFGISSNFIQILGRSSDLTGRADIWKLVKEQQVSPLFGFGYSMFWSSIGKAMKLDIVQAHNGYLDIYVDGGIVGLFFLAYFIISAGMNSISALETRTLYDRVRFIFFIIPLAYNWTETAYLRAGILWFVVILSSLIFVTEKSSDISLANKYRLESKYFSRETKSKYIYDT
jgi:exopolysaccharide production protein ExoQ